MRRQRALVIDQVALSLRRLMRDDNRQEEKDLCLELVSGESHFNFIKMHLRSHFCDHTRQFGNIPIYSTEIQELAQKTQIKDGWRQSNKNDAACHILHSYVLKFFVYFLCIFNTLPCILLLSLCSGSACPPLTLLQLRYILWSFIVYFRIISRDLTCAFQSGV